MDAYLLSSQVGRALGISAQRVRSLEREKKLVAVKTTGGVRLFRLVDIQRFKEKRSEDREANR
jgi:DNA-binding transcriptional MerR regulator